MPKGGYDNEWLNKLREANDLVAIMSTYLPLKRIGRKHWANCPFHHEKSPSMCINEDEQYYHCFGCGESGNVISFIMKMESLDFLEAVNFLAKKCGMQVPEFNNSDDLREKKQKRDRAFEMLSVAKEFYKDNLGKSVGENALKYLETRGITSQEIEKFELGFSPDFNSLINTLKKQRYNIDEMVDFGLVAKGEGKEYDFFAKRLIFPIHNKYGDCVGFSGRDMEGRTHAKYKNSPQSIVFDKSSLIYGLHLVKKLKNEQLKSLILCEGQMDVIAMHKAGFVNSVACLGTALTESHAKEITHLVDKVVLCFDGDSAGQNAIIKAINVLKNYDLTLRVVALPSGKDPDEILKEKGKEYLAELINGAMDSMEFELRYIAKQYDLKDNLGRTKFLKNAIALLNTLSLQAERDVYIPLISQLSNVSGEVIRRDLVTTPLSVAKTEQKQELVHTADKLLKSQRFVLASMLHKKDYVNLDDDFNLCSKNPYYNQLYAELKQYLDNNTKFAVASILEQTSDENISQLNEIINIDLDNFDESGEKYFKECIKQIKIFALTTRENEIKALINQEPDMILRSKLLKNLQEISQKKYKVKTEE